MHSSKSTSGWSRREQAYQNASFRFKYSTKYQKTGDISSRNAEK